MCITKKATKKPILVPPRPPVSPKLKPPVVAPFPGQLVDTTEKKMSKEMVMKSKTPRQRNLSKESRQPRTASTAATTPVSVADLATQLVEEPRLMEATAPSEEHSKRKAKLMKKSSPIDPPPPPPPQQKPAKSQVKSKMLEPRKPDKPTPKSLMSGNVMTKKKAAKMKMGGQVERDDFSVNVDKTEFLENAQLTKLMSHADVKALMGGQVVQGIDDNENSCRDTVEEVDSEMQDIAFSPLLVGIAKEEEKAYGVLYNSQEPQGGRKMDSVG